jgi:hypothetical protein
VDEEELKRLLEIVSDKGLKALSVDELFKLHMLVEEKDYRGNKKADKAKKKLLGKINAEIYNKHSPRRLF